MILSFTPIFPPYIIFNFWKSSGRTAGMDTYAAGCSDLMFPEYHAEKKRANELSIKFNKNK
ncbi:hypothetical protein DXA40_17700 [Blautia sp. OF01-4LB]|nr:hypothetical protein DXA40_17700 [Blautia sp. OF01-4LB]